MAISSKAIVTQFNLADGVKAERKMLKTYFNDGTYDTQKNILLGYGVEESTIELSPDTDTKTDILGITSTNVNKLEMAQTLEPMTVTGGDTHLLQVRLEDILARQALGEFSTFPVIIVKEYITIGTGETAAFYAEYHKNCSIYPTSIGGSSTLDMPIEITFSNDKVLGSFKNGIFTPTTPSA